jgi:hypothetical protein
MSRPLLLTLSLGVCIAGSILPATATDAEGEDAAPYRGGFAYIGAFFVTSIDTEASVFSQQLPLGRRISLSRDLGLDESLAIPRVNVSWRFNKRHMMGFGWYDLDRRGTKTLSRTIELFDQEFVIGAEVESFFRTQIFKTSYTWLFHADPKVDLGLSAGLFIGDLEAGIRVAGLGSMTGSSDSVTAPLPVLGGRLDYRVGKKLEVRSTFEWFFINYSDYEGVLADIQAMLNHRTFQHVGFGVGVNIQTSSVEYTTDGFLWDVEESFVGGLVVMSLFW